MGGANKAVLKQLVHCLSQAHEFSEGMPSLYSDLSHLLFSLLLSPTLSSVKYYKKVKQVCQVSSKCLTKILNNSIIRADIGEDRWQARITIRFWA
jgi:hypothetical protein